MYKKYKKVIINGKNRVLYKLPNSNKLYIKFKRNIILYKDYKKLKGGIMYDKKIGNRIREILVEIYNLRNELNYYPQTLHGVNMVKQTNIKIKNLDTEIDNIMDNNPLFKKKDVLNDILKNDEEVKESLQRWINSFN